MQKTSFFAAALSDRSFRASPSSLKRDENNAIQSSKSLSANGTVAQSRRSEHLWRTMWIVFKHAVSPIWPTERREVFSSQFHQKQDSETSRLLLKKSLAKMLLQYSNKLVHLTTW